MEVRVSPGLTTCVAAEACTCVLPGLPAGARPAASAPATRLGALPVAPVDEMLAGRDGGGRLCVSTRPRGTEAVASPADLAAIGLENGFSLKRAISPLQPASAAAIVARTATRAYGREQDSTTQRMTNSLE